jgi:hypothetical protein
MLREENGSTKYARNERGQEEVTTELRYGGNLTLFSLKTSLCTQRDIERGTERETERDLSPFVFVTGKKIISFFALEGESNGERGVSVQYTAAVEVHTPWDRRYVFLA